MDSITLEVTTGSQPATFNRLVVTPRADPEHGGSARFDLETRDGVPLASFTLACEGAADLMAALTTIFPSDWQTELQPVPVPYGLPLPLD